VTPGAGADGQARRRPRVLPRSRALLGLGAALVALLTAAAPAEAGTRDRPRDPDQRRQARIARDAARAASRAAKALDRGRPVAAVLLAERAVMLDPRDPGHRALLGRAYLRGGRFASAAAALGEALAMRPGDGRVALDLALAQAANGDDAAALATLDAHAAAIPAADLGLALALSGRPGAGAMLLLDAVRAPGADARARQNLALALALGGEWRMARAVAGADLSPAALDERMLAWAALAQPGLGGGRVAAVLGVTPVADPGRPVTLALAVPAAVPAAAAPVDVTARVPAPPPAVVFAPRHEVVQPLPASRPAGQGGWVIQVGAYADGVAARAGWARIRRFPPFADATPVEATRRAGGRSLRGLAVAGYDRAGADAMCRRYRDAGGDCFVRASSGDRVAGWATDGPTRLAAR